MDLRLFVTHETSALSGLDTPLTDILSQAAAIAVGKSLSGTLGVLKKNESAIGLACLVLAVVHLLLGGLWLV